jgi:hypothetical protein
MQLVAEAGTYGNLVATLRATARQYGSAALGLHARAKSMGLGTMTAVRLKCALGHKAALLNLSEK